MNNRSIALIVLGVLTATFIGVVSFYAAISVIVVHFVSKYW